MDTTKINQLKGFIDTVKANPEMLYRPELGFFKSYLESLGATLPPKTEDTSSAEEEEEEQRMPRTHETHGESSPKETPQEEEEEPIVDPPKPDESIFNDPSDPEKLEPESEAVPSTGPEDKVELRDDEMDKQNGLKQEATEALEDGDLHKALDKYSEAIDMGGATALLFARRATVLLKLKRPLAAISDADAALKLNPDSGRAYRIRGIANRKLQRWEQAHSDLAAAQNIDFDEATEEVHKYVDEKWDKISQMRREYQNQLDENNKLRKEREIKKRRAAAQKAYEAQKEADEEHHPQSSSSSMPGGFPGGMPGGMPHMSDPDLQAAFSNPKVMAAMQEMMQNPANAMKYMSDPEVGPILQKLMSKVGGAMPGGGFPGAH
ncbi:hypothetical protein FOL47_001522 [Perkinsus chesapeaki]|uniref:STI1 domain-containing protein n=1 Tax=Perkinsus chesapeaki TaxID=330153 RepID=A0A7J6MJV3_PERCH|nr:hypothetical protein FOL47_001522 [Perkinsus chesapeaki]